VRGDWKILEDAVPSFKPGERITQTREPSHHPDIKKGGGGGGGEKGTCCGETKKERKKAKLQIKVGGDEVRIMSHK